VTWLGFSPLSQSKKQEAFFSRTPAKTNKQQQQQKE